MLDSAVIRSCAKCFARNYNEVGQA